MGSNSTFYFATVPKDPEAANTYFYLKDWNVRPLMVHPDTLDYVMELWAECGFRQEYADALG